MAARIGIGRLLAGLAIGAVGIQVALQLGLRDRPSPGAFGEALQMLRDHLGRGVIRRQHAFAAGHFFLRHQGAFPFDPIEDHGGKDAVAIFIEHLRRVGIQEQPSRYCG